MKRRFLVFALLLVMVCFTSVSADNVIHILSDETFQVYVDSQTKTASKSLNFSLNVPEYRNATLFLAYDNAVNGSITERCKVLQLSVSIDDINVIAKHYDDGVQSSHLETTLNIVPSFNHTGQVIVYGTSDTVLRGTVNLWIEIIGSNDGFFNINFNPLDFGANWWFWGLISGVAVIGTIIAVKKRRSGAEV